MKKHIISLTILLTATFSWFTANSQNNDDIYFDGVEERKYLKDEYLNEEPVVKSNDYDKSEDKYVDEDYEYEYSARVRRFHNPARGFSYYSNYYVYIKGKNTIGW